MEVTVSDGIHVAGLRVEARGRALLSGVSFDLPKGSFTAIIGPSGCGKSTLVKTLAGVIPSTDGRISMAGYEVEEITREFPLAVGYLPQFGAFHSQLTVRENLQYAADLRLPGSVANEVRENWINHIIELSRIGKLLDQPYSTLSGGQMRRIALAEQLIGDPAFLLLDELTSGLDAYSDREIMIWLRELAHTYGKTIVLVTHATYHLEYCDSVLVLHHGKQAFHGDLNSLLAAHEVDSVTELLAFYENDPVELEDVISTCSPPEEPLHLRTSNPPSGWKQFPTLLARQFVLFLRERSQIWLHLALILTFPALVAVFAYKGLPEVRQLNLALESNIVKSLVEQLQHAKDSLTVASLVSGLAMFQVVLLTLMGANNGAREIAKELEVVGKELRTGLSPWAYVLSKFVQIVLLSGVQAFWMAWFVKWVCGFPGDLGSQFAILFATTLAMSTTCLAISAGSPSPERASLLSIYLVGFQLPLSGAALALPDWLSAISRPFIDAYWGWSGYLYTFQSTRHFDIVKQSTNTAMLPLAICFAALAAHVVVGLVVAWYFVRQRRFR